MKLGITGAAGFIGRNLVAAAVARGHQVRALVHRTPAELDVETRLLDLAAPDGLEHAIEGLDALVHAAAYVPSSYTDPDEAGPCFQINALGTLALLRAAQRASVRKLVVLSGNVYRFSTSPVSEDAPFGPSPHAPYYLASKACADMFVEQFRYEQRLDTVVLRPSSVYGPGLRRGMLGAFLHKLERRERVVIQNGDRYRTDLVHVGDVANAALAALERAVAGPFNVGSGTTFTASQIAETLAKIVDAPRTLIEVEPATEAVPIGFAPLAIDRARRELDYAPRSLESGLVDFVAWSRGQP